MIQQIRLAAGQAHLDRDGSATVRWKGSWSVNFYGGLVPFTVTDPDLEIDEDGTGTLTADLSGYASSQEDPNTRTPLPPVSDVTVATFRDVDLDPAGTITINPDYAGVDIDVPSDRAAQDTTSAGWGSWPQAFVDFHFDTGLSSYWYSSGGAADPLKAPTALTVDFTDAVPTTPQVDVASKTTVSLARKTLTYGTSTTATVQVTASGATPTGKVTVKAHGKTVTGTLANGKAVVALPKNLKPGRYPVVVTFPGAAGIKPSNAQGTLTVTKAKPTVSLSCIARPSRSRSGARPP
ncbi:Ig-like domain-containing protein [Aeromicrobium sp. UC242_57]|uniref:Ig-like domain-containing protein n=1 Tax=Aeromicrobium sp. UC242_57 TaxID=3374624 RepID=UPI0037A7B601